MQAGQEAIADQRQHEEEGSLMKTVTGVFSSQEEAQRAVSAIHSSGLSVSKTTLLSPGADAANAKSVPVVASEQPGMGAAVGAVAGAAAGMSGGPLLLAALIPGIGPITAIGLLGGAFLAAAGATVGGVAGKKLENSMTEGLPEDELFVYEDALRKGRSVILALVHDEATAAKLRELMKTEGAETVDAARDQWWIGLRNAEDEHYSAKGRPFSDDEKFYRMGFESALHARTRCKEYDQVLGEMNAQLEELEQQYPGKEVAAPFTHGYQRGRQYYQQLCDQSKAA
jgi:hypothetical protein